MAYPTVLGKCPAKVERVHRKDISLLYRIAQFQGDYLKLAGVVGQRSPTVLNFLQEATSGTQVATAGMT